MYHKVFGNTAWSTIVPSDSTESGITKIVVTNTGTLYALSDRIDKSDDLGNTWETVYSPYTFNFDFDEQRAIDIAVYGWSDIYYCTEAKTRSAHEPVYTLTYTKNAGTKWNTKRTGWDPFYFATDKLGTLYAYNHVNIVKTNDPDTDWTTFSLSPESTKNPIQFIQGRYPVICSFDTDRRLKYTLNDGQDWTSLPKLPDDHNVVSFLVLEDNTIVALYEHIGTTHIVTTTMYDSDWTEVYSFPVQVNTLAQNVNGNLLLGANSAGLLEFDMNSHLLHTVFNGYEPGTVTSIFASTSGMVYATEKNQCIYTKHVDSVLWERSDAFASSYHVHFIESANGNVFFNGANILRTTDNGAHWTSVLNQQEVRYLSYSSDRILFACTSNGVYQSATDGDSWTSVPLPDSLHTIAKQYVSLNGGVKLLVSTIGLLYQSDDDGVTWYRVQSYCRDVERIITTLKGNIYILQQDGIARYFDPTSHIASQLFYTSASVRDIATTVNEDILLATSDGFRFSTTYGTSWWGQNAGLPSKDITCVTASTHGFLYAGNRNAGVYQLAHQPVTIRHTPLPSIPTLMPAYPNPLSQGSTGTLIYQSSRTGYAVVSIFNEAGACLQKWTEYIMQPESHRIMVNTKTLKPGVYTISIQIDEWHASQRLIVQ